MELLYVLLICAVPTVILTSIHAYVKSGDWHPFFSLMFGGIIFGISFAITSGILYWIE